MGKIHRGLDYKGQKGTTSPWSLHSVVGREADNGTPKGLTSGALILEPLELWKEQGNMFP